MLVLYLTVVVFMIRRKAYTFDYNSLKGVYYVVLNRVPDIMKILRGAYITSDTPLSKPVGFQYTRTKYTGSFFYRSSLNQAMFQA